MYCSYITEYTYALLIKIIRSLNTDNENVRVVFVCVFVHLACREGTFWESATTLVHEYTFYSISHAVRELSVALLLMLVTKCKT